MSDKYLYIILARAGSVRLPKKNIKKFCGKPLICWTISQAIRLAKQDKVLVSTDDEEIKKIVKKNKKIYLHHRKKKLSSDTASSIDVIRNILNDFKEEENIILLQPTSPLRQDSDIEKAKSLIKSGKEAVMSQSSFQYTGNKINCNQSFRYYKSMYKKNKKIFIPISAISKGLVLLDISKLFIFIGFI